MPGELTVAIDECLAKKLAPDSKRAVTLLWDVLCDPGEWDIGTLRQLERLRKAAPAKPKTVGKTKRKPALVKFERSTVVAGDLVVDGDIECLAHTLVLGDVKCSGYLYSGIHDGVIVCGDLVARGLEAQRSYWLIGGSIEAETTWLSTYGFLINRGALRTRLLLLQMYFELRGKGPIRAKSRIETNYLPDDDAAKTRLRKVLDVDPLLDDEGDVDSFELLRRVARGKPVFRQPARRRR